MSRIVEYPKFVNKELIQVEEKDECRFWLKIPFYNTTGAINNKTVCVILKNPSKATCTQSDNTVSKVCNAAYNNGYKTVIILNLFPYRSTKPQKVIKFYKQDDYDVIMHENISVIKKLSQGNDIVFAWGTNTISTSIRNQNIYDDTIHTVLNSCNGKRYYVKSKKSNDKNQVVPMYPLHGLRWCNDSEFHNYNYSTK